MCVRIMTYIWGSDGDILSPQVFTKTLSAIKRQGFSVVHFGMPCESWSLARKWDGGPPPLRDNDLFFGRQNLTRHDREKVLRGNELLKSTCQLALACMKFEIPGTIENPQTSRAWLTHEMHGLIGKGAFFQMSNMESLGKRLHPSSDGWFPTLILSSVKVPLVSAPLRSANACICRVRTRQESF